MEHAEKDPNKRHRHDVGEVAHGPESTEGVTKALQAILALAIIGTIALVAYALYHSAS